DRQQGPERASLTAYSVSPASRPTPTALRAFGANPDRCDVHPRCTRPLHLLSSPRALGSAHINRDVDLTQRRLPTPARLPPGSHRAPCTCSLLETAVRADRCDAPPVLFARRHPSWLPQLVAPAHRCRHKQRLHPHTPATRDTRPGTPSRHRTCASSTSVQLAVYGVQSASPPRHGDTRPTHPHHMICTSSGAD
ncbi:hypothetical protein DENSPDRAFT_846456, partial [Dentipellis sp. KUC8613]